MSYGEEELTETTGQDGAPLRSPESPAAAYGETEYVQSFGKTEKTEREPAAATDAGTTEGIPTGISTESPAEIHMGTTAETTVQKTVISRQSEQSPDTSPATEKLSENRALKEAEAESALLKESLALSEERCNRLIERETAEIAALAESNRENVKAVNSGVYKQLMTFLEQLREENGKVMSSQRKLSEELRENNEGLGSEVKGCVGKLEKQLTESISELNRTMDRATESLATRVGELSKTYREILESSLAELKETKEELASEKKREPVTKKETADLIRTGIESTSKELTEYYRRELSGSVSALNTSLKKAKEDFDELEEERKRGGKLARAMKIATPALLIAACVISIVGLFV